ncbi:DUF805 domain-containing protein [Shinella curvata]|uniref:DUF805 domain-containing protein n=1 Tax=Shinella curvata TaxID=1817964 RepID=A0ABT8X9P8_9HYPH|nr:DUF805 domain-containing protein [Shinella curvata]MCJ8055144.1 DUF805 domain-containing protein [Shinella curvata]MDO6120460.1 DUF805 domain-containing protein [Shinella curvata]
MEKLKGIDFKYLFLSYEGRIGRRDFWISVAVMLAVGVVMSIVSSILGAIYAPLAYIVSVVSLATIYPACAAYAKRWHDRGKSGWWTLVALVPLAGILYMIWELGIQPSIEQSNAWGEKPVPAAI